MTLNFEKEIKPFMLGRPVNMEEWNAISRVLAGDSNLNFGEPVIKGSEDGTCEGVTNAQGIFIGVAGTDQVLPHPGDYYKPGDTVCVYNRVVIPVKIGAFPVKAGDHASFDYDNRVWTSYRADGKATPGCAFENDAPANAITLLRVLVPVGDPNSKAS